MRNIINRALFCVVLFCISAPFAKLVTIHGTIADTVLETGNGKDPVLKIIPVEACSLSIAAGCTEEKQDKYFAKTDRFGNYSLTINLPETCTYKRYLLSVNGYTSANTAVMIGSGSIPVDSITDTLIRNLRIPHPLPVSTISTSSYSYRFEVSGNTQIRGGDTIGLRHVMTGLVDKPDTLHFKKCQFRIFLLTSSNDTVYSSNFNCAEGDSWIYLQKNWYTDETYKIPVPKDLQKTNSAFVIDRKLTLVFKYFDYDISYTTTFSVIDNDIPLVNATSIHTLKNIPMSNSAVALSVKSNRLYLRVFKPGIYSIDLFSLDGRMQQHIAKEHDFSAGEHVYAMYNTAANSSKMLIAKILGNGLSSTAMVNKL